MKRLLLPFLISFCCLNFSGLKAQPTLTAIDLSMQAGDQYLIAEIANSFSPAPPYYYMFFSNPAVGANIIWDFSHFTAINSYSINGLDRNIAPLPNEFSAANLVEKKGGRYAYFQNTGNKITHWGNAQITPYDTSRWEYDVPYDAMRFPVTATSAYTDSFSYKVPGYYNNICTAVEYYFFETVGYGTLITPAGTFNSAMLIKTITESKPDTCGPLFIHSKFTEYLWYASGYHQPLVRFSKSDASLGTLYRGYYLQKNITGNIEEKAAQLNLQTFPNPATSEVTVQYQLKTPSETQIVLTDALGKVVLQKQEKMLVSGSYSKVIDVSNLPKGVYLVRLETADNVAIKKLLIQ